MMKTLPQISSYQENGFYVFENAFDKNDIQDLRRETVRICRDGVGLISGLEAYEEGESDDEVLRRTLAIHFPHKLSELMKEAIAHTTIAQTLQTLVGPNIKCMQSMLFIKSSGKPGQAWHQDELFIPTRDRSLTAAWIAMDDATVENGCLWVIPGSHKRGLLWPQRVQNNQDFDCTDESYRFPYNDGDAIPVQVEAGSIVFFNGYLLHRSLPNRANTGFRRALVGHYMSAESFLPWYPPREGEYMGTVDIRDVLMVAGEDPYGYKGYEAVHTPHVRPSGEGGCVR